MAANMFHVIVWLNSKISMTDLKGGKLVHPVMTPVTIFDTSHTYNTSRWLQLIDELWDRFQSFPTFLLHTQKYISFIHFKPKDMYLEFKNLCSIVDGMIFIAHLRCGPSPCHCSGYYHSNCLRHLADFDHHYYFDFHLDLPADSMVLHSYHHCHHCYPCYML